MAHYAGNSSEGYVPFSFDQPVVNDGGSGPIPEVPTQSQAQPDDALAKLWELAQSDPAYMETYLQALAERENTLNAQAWYEKMSGSQYQRAMDDLRKAGVNPWLALQSLGGAGSGSIQPARSWSTSPYANMIAKQNAQTNKDQNAIKIAGLMATSLLAILALIV